MQENFLLGQEILETLSAHIRAQVVFSLTSQGNDLFSSMTRVSVASLRISNPTLRVVIACDLQTASAMRQAQDPLVGEVDEFLAFETPQGNTGFRNRYIKTNLRSLITGPFLFLDSDIFVRGDLGGIFELDCDIAGARNHSRQIFPEQVWTQDRATLETMGWEIGEEIYINGGVLFYNDTAGARNFAAEWHRRWLDSATGRNYYRDQPALNSALHVVRPKFNLLPDRYNAQLLTEPRVAADAVIWHYYSSAGQPAMTSFDILVQQILHGGNIDYDVIRRMIECCHPWRCKNFVDSWAVQRLMRHGAVDGWEVAWLRRGLNNHVTVSLHRALAKAKQFFSMADR